MLQTCVACAARNGKGSAAGGWSQPQWWWCKGLAQAEILQAIDSAGLQVNVLTGTNMGGMVGALYAVG